MSGCKFILRDLKFKSAFYAYCKKICGHRCYDTPHTLEVLAFPPCYEWLWNSNPRKGLFKFARRRYKKFRIVVSEAPAFTITLPTKQRVEQKSHIQATNLPAAMSDRRYHSWFNAFDAETEPHSDDYASPCSGSQSPHSFSTQTNSYGDQVSASSCPADTHVHEKPQCEDMAMEENRQEPGLGPDRPICTYPEIAKTDHQYTHAHAHGNTQSAPRRRLLDPCFVHHDGFDSFHNDSFGGVWRALLLFY